MKFERITNELYGARHAGYKIDTTVPHEIDEEVMDQVAVDNGRNWADGQIDALYDCDGDLYRGEDGLYYIVCFVTVGGKTLPLAWQRMIHD